MDPLNVERRKISNDIREKKEQFQTLCKNHNIALPKDEDDIPSMLFIIDGKAEEIVKEKIKNVIQDYYPQMNLSSSPEDRQKLYNQYLEKKRLAEQVQTQISSLITLAELPENIKDSYTVSIQPINRGDTTVFRFVTSNILMGYSIYDLLYGIDLLSPQLREEYRGCTTFELDLKGFNKTKTHLSELILWSEDFLSIVGDLLGNVDSAKRHISIGQKPISEILSNPIRMSNQVVDQLKKNPHAQPCLLFNQVSINLTDHADRDFIKKKFEEFYTAENMIGANKKPKTFLIDDPYRSNLNVTQLKKICPRLNKLLKLQQLLKEFTSGSTMSQALAISKGWGIPDELNAMKQYKATVLIEICKNLSLEPPLLTSIEEATSLDALESISLKYCQDLLEQNMGIFFKTREVPYQPSTDDIRSLYINEEYITYLGNQRLKNISKLLTALKNSPIYKKILTRQPDLESAVSKLQAELISRLNNYSTLQSTGFYGKEMIDNAIRFLEMYVAKIVNNSQSKITEASIECSLIQLAAMVDSNEQNDLSGGCATGLAGRIQNLLTSLTSNTGNDFQDDIIQFMKESLESAFGKCFMNDRESSMRVNYKKDIIDYFITGASNSLINNDDYNAQRLLHSFFVEYNPVSIYQRAYSFFSAKFWQLNRDDDDNGIYQLFKDLEFMESSKEEIDKKYRVNGDATKKWQYAYFQQELPRYLVKYLVSQGLLFVKQRKGIFYQKAGLPPQAVSVPQQTIYQAPSSSRPIRRIEQPIVPNIAVANVVADSSRALGRLTESQLPDCVIHSS